MQSTGHETQAEKPAHIPLTTLPKEPQPFSLYSGSLDHFVAFCLTNLASWAGAVPDGSIAPFSILYSLCRKRLRRNLLYPSASKPQHTLTTPGERQIMRCNEGGELMLAMKSRNQGENGFRSLS